VTNKGCQMIAGRYDYCELGLAGNADPASIEKFPSDFKSPSLFTSAVGKGPRLGYVDPHVWGPFCSDKEINPNDKRFRNNCHWQK